MLKPIIEKSELRFACDPARRGYNAVYRRDQTNHCPGCGRTHWYVGRISAECGFCATALPFAELEYSASGMRRSWRQAAA